MELPILEKLKEQVKFDFETLASNVEQADEFWNWWWEEKFEQGKIGRPEIIVDDDSILTPTCHKSTVNLVSYSEFFDNPLAQLLQRGVLPAGPSIARDNYRDLIVEFVANSKEILQDRPQIVFAGGGYGSGKTTILNYLASSKKLPVGMASQTGVDVFKQLIPEYQLIKGVADGRASLTVQQECQVLADRLFNRLIEEHRSFIWDSSMSNKEETLKRLKTATMSGYELTLIAVFTPLDQAVDQAMHRAKITRRFPHPEALPKSHKAFREAFLDYIPHFDEVQVFANNQKLSDSPFVVGQKEGKENNLVSVAAGLLETTLKS